MDEMLVGTTNIHTERVPCLLMSSNIIGNISLMTSKTKESIWHYFNIIDNEDITVQKMDSIMDDSLEIMKQENIQHTKN